MATARVLVIDDEPGILDFVDHALNSSGYEVLRASGPREALEIAGRNRIDLVLSDVRLPGMSGLQLVKRVTRLSPATATLLMSSWASSPDVPSHVEVLRKPFSAKTLVAKVERTLRQAEQARSVLHRDLERADELRADTGHLLADLMQAGAAATATLDRSRCMRQQVALSSGHSSADILERYSLGCLGEPDLGRLEEHLLVCEACQVRLEQVDGFVGAIQAAARELRETPLNLVHFTEDGPIRLSVERADDDWQASFDGRELEGAERFSTLAEANDNALESFRLMFPEHQCDERCSPGDESTPAPSPAAPARLGKRRN